MAEIRANNVPDDLLKKFDMERAKRGRMSIKDAVIQALTVWMGSEASATKVNSGDEIHALPDDRQRLIKSLLEMFDSRDPMTRQDLSHIKRLVQIYQRHEVPTTQQQEESTDHEHEEATQSHQRRRLSK